jgi:hypothetical protein
MNTQNIELQSLYTALKITNVKVKRKAEEFLRLLEVRAPGGFKHVRLSLIFFCLLFFTQCEKNKYDLKYVNSIRV